VNICSLSNLIESRKGKEPDPEFRKLYPHLSEEELIEAQENFDSEKEPDPEFPKISYPHLSDDDELVEAQADFDGHLEGTRQIFQRIREDPKEYARFKRLVEEQKKLLAEPDHEDPDPPLLRSKN
jgi:hypothetical protein